MESILDYALLAAVIAGITEFLNRLRGRDYWSALTVATAAITGGVFGFFGIEGLDVITGIAAGFGTSGALSAFGIVGKKSPTVPSEPLSKPRMI